MNGRRYLLLSTLLLTAIFVMANLMVQPRLAGVRLDLTENRLYSLSPGTKATLRNLAEPVELTLVYSRVTGREYPAIRAHAARVRELLAAYGAMAGGRLQVTEIDPAPFTEAEDKALAAGVSALETNSGDPLYLGLIGRNTVDDTRLIAFLSPDREATLEYDLTRLIARLDDPEPPRVGVLTTLEGMRGIGEERGYFVLKELARSFRLVEIPEDFTDLPQDLDALLLAHPPDLTDTQAWWIDQFVLRQGRLMVLVDPAAKAAGGGDPFVIGGAAARSDIPRLLRHWGVALSRDALADAATALPVEARTPDGRVEVVGQPLFLAPPPAMMNRQDVVTAELMRAVHFGAPGAIEPLPGLTLTLVPLVRTGPSPAFIDAGQAMRDVTPVEVIRAYDALDGARHLAVRLSGPVTTAFPDGPPQPDLTGDRVRDDLARAALASAPEHLAGSARPVEIVLVADTDLLNDGFYINPATGRALADNAAFVLNGMDVLSGAGNLLSLRARAPAQRAMSRVERMRRRAEARYFDRQAALQTELAASEARLSELQDKARAGEPLSGPAGLTLPPDETAELERLRARIVAARTQLRAIERDFRSEIDRLETVLKAVNIWAAPLLVALTGLIVWLLRRGGTA